MQGNVWSIEISTTVVSLNDLNAIEDIGSSFAAGNIVRRCCPSDCGAGDGVRAFEGRDPVYFCSDDGCNGEMADGNLASGGSTTSPPGLTTTGGNKNSRCAGRGIEQLFSS